MRTILIVAAGALTALGCNQVFGLSPPADDAPPVDAASIDAAPSCLDASGMPDEDRDGIRDECDTCPHVMDKGGDSDGDGIDDACDPREDLDRLVAFYGFNQAPAGFQGRVDGSTGTWQFVDGTLRLDAGAAGADYLALFELTEQDVTVEAGFTITDVAANGDHGVGVRANLAAAAAPSGPAYDPTLPPGMALEVSDAGGAPRLRLVAIGADNSRLVTEQEDAGWFSQGVSYRVRLDCYATCSGSARRMNDGGVGQPGSVATESRRAGAVGLAVTGASVAFDYLVVYAPQ